MAYPTNLLIRNWTFIFWLENQVPLMLIYLKNADLGRTERKPGAYFTQATQPENPGSEAELGLGSQTHQAKGRKSPRAGSTASILPSDCEYVEKRIEGMQEYEPDVSRRNCSLFLFKMSFLPRTLI